MRDELLHEFIQRLNEIPNISCKLLSTHKINKEIDARIEISYNGQKEIFEIEGRDSILPATLSMAWDSERMPSTRLLLANYITPKTRVTLQDRKISYADSVGNLFIGGKGIYLFKETNKSGRSMLQNRNAELGKAGLQVVYQFLIRHEEDFVNRPYREIAEQSLVTIDTVRRTIHFLLNEKFILQQAAKRYVYNDKKVLFETWVYGYNKKLKPKLQVYKFKNVKSNKAWGASLLPSKTLWGGVRAAEILNGKLIAEEQVMYSGLHVTKLLHELLKITPVVPDAGGALHVRQAFWKIEESNENKSLVVNPILIYADLISHPNPRAVEEAQTIYVKEIKNKL